MPYQIISSVWVGSDPEHDGDWHGEWWTRGRVDRRILGWWLAFVIGLTGVNVGNLLADDALNGYGNLEDLAGADGLLAVSHVVLAGAALAAVWVVRAVTERQQATARRLGTAV